MKRQVRGTGPDPDQASQATPPASGGPESFDVARDVELLEDRTIRIGSGRTGRRLGLSVPGAVGGTFLVVALAFGAAGGLTGPQGGGSHGGDRTARGDQAGTESDGAGPLGDGGQGADGDAWAGEGRTEAVDAPETPDATEVVEPTKEPVVEPTKAPEPDPTKKPEPKPEPTKAPTYGPTLSLGLKDGKPVIEWTACKGFEFDYYKVVRSTDSTVTWPLGGGDSLIGVVEPGGWLRAWDDSAPTGKTLSYRVFCVRSTDAGYLVLKASAVKSINVPAVEPNPVPDPVHLGLETSVTDGGAVKLAWSACNVDGFVYYKVVRSTTTENPSYFPWTDGTELIGVVSEVGATGWTDSAVESGQTIWYRIQCLGYVGDQKVLLGQSDVVAVTLP